MVRTRVKGNRIVRKCKLELEKRGFEVGHVERKGKFIKIKDLWGLFDLIAIKPEILIFIQVVANTPHTHKKYKEWAKMYANVHVWVEQWVGIDYKGWKRYKYYPSGKYDCDKFPYGV